MKRIIFACFLLTAVVSIAPLTNAMAYAAPAPVTTAAFTAKVNTMDGQIAAGNITGAQATWNEIHNMMISVLGTTKSSIQSATTPTATTSFTTILNNQIAIYNVVWGLKPDLATNRAAIHTKLLEFAATIY